LVVVVASCQSANQSPPADLMFCANQAVFSVTLDSDGKAEMDKVVDLPDDATCPVWSPDGKFAVLYRYRQLEPFVQEDSLNLIDRQSGTIREAYRFGPSDNEWTIHWLSDGVELLLASARDTMKQGNTKCNPAVRSLNDLHGLFCWAAYADFYRSKISFQDGTTNFERLTDSPMLRCELELSPDGSKLAYTHGTLCSEGTGDEGNVSALDLDTKTVSSIIDAAAYIANHPGSVNRSVPAGWSPNSEQLAISGLQDNYVAQNFIADSAGLHSVPPEGVYGRTWLPDGKRLLWFDRGFGVTNIESGTVETLPITIDPQHGIDGRVVSPNGKYLAWRETDDQDKTGQIRIYDFAEGTTATVLNIIPGTLVWSPDSQLLAFPVKKQLKPNSCNYQIDIYVVKPDATGLRNLTEGRQMKTLPCRFAGGMGWRWYDRFVKDVQWVPHN
jgi:Tol biopolymer transport system component